MSLEQIWEKMGIGTTTLQILTFRNNLPLLWKQELKFEMAEVAQSWRYHSLQFIQFHFLPSFLGPSWMTLTFPLPGWFSDCIECFCTFFYLKQSSRGIIFLQATLICNFIFRGSLYNVNYTDDIPVCGMCVLSLTFKGRSLQIRCVPLSPNRMAEAGRETWFIWSNPPALAGPSLLLWRERRNTSTFGIFRTLLWPVWSNDRNSPISH